MGEVVFVADENCPDPDAVEARVWDALYYGRIGARSSAYHECIRDAVTVGIPRMIGNGTIGPFKPCAKTDLCDAPWLRTATDGQKTAWLLSQSNTPLDTRVKCDGDTSLCGECGFMVKQEAFLPDGMEGLRIIDLGSNPRKNAGLMWHEFMHNHGCGHHPSASDCGYTEGYRNDHNGPINIVGTCMREVLLQSEASPVCAALSCPTDEEPMIVHYGEFGAANGCECVPDVHRFPAHENETGDRYGDSLAVGDFNGDGYDDLAIGAPGESSSMGSVYLMRGSAVGLLFWKRISQYDIAVYDFAASPAGPYRPWQQAGDQFGYALAAGDLNGDGPDELVVGAPGRDDDSGVVYVFGGSADGLDIDRVEWLAQESNDGETEAGDRYGASLAIGRFNDDIYRDLAVGAPYEVHGSAQSGVASVHLGRAGEAGVSSFVSSEGFLHQALGVWGNESGDEFGYALAAGDVDGNSIDEVIVGAPGENDEKGYVYVARRSSRWSVVRAIQTSGSSTRFGAVVHVDDLVGDGIEDIAVGSPDDLAGHGSVWIWRGTTSAPVYTARMSGNEMDGFGSSLTTVHLTSLQRRDLAVGAYRAYENTYSGAVFVYKGTTSNTFDTLSDGHVEVAHFFDAGAGDWVLPPLGDAARFGASLASGRFTESERSLAVGAPTHAVEGRTSGAVFTFSKNLLSGRRIDQRTMRYGEAPFQ